MYKIAFEGIDGSGKSTQANIAYKRLKEDKQNEKVEFFYEPKSIRSDIMDTCKQIGQRHINDAFITYLFGIDGYYNRQEELKSNADIIIRDRDTTVSNYAYHHTFGTQEEMLYYMAWQLNKINGVDLIIFVDVSAELAIKRILTRAPEKKIESYFEKEEKLQQVRKNYKGLFSDKNKLKWCGIDTAKIFIVNGETDIDTVHSDIYKIITENI